MATFVLVHGACHDGGAGTACGHTPMLARPAELAGTLAALAP